MVEDGGSVPIQPPKTEGRAIAKLQPEQPQLAAGLDRTPEC
jgi:hypothetical protein